MKRMLAAALFVAVAAPALAVPINYLAELSNGVPVAGSIPLNADGNGVDNPEDWDWYRFYAEAGNVVTVTVRRTTAGIDPASSAYLGLPADTNPMTTVFDTPAGATLMGQGDDNLPPNVPGPFGDPEYVFVAPSDGHYSVVVANFLGLFNDPGNYNITVRGITPEPTSALLLGLAGLITARRFRR